MTLAGDHHAIVRAKDLESTSIMYAYQSGDAGLIIFMQDWIRNATQSKVIDYTGSILGAIRGGHLPLLMGVIDKDNSISPYKMYKTACQFKQYDIVEFLLFYFAQDDLKIDRQTEYNITFNPDDEVWKLERERYPCCKSGNCASCCVRQIIRMGYENTIDYHDKITIYDLDINLDDLNNLQKVGLNEDIRKHLLHGACVAGNTVLANKISDIPKDDNTIRPHILYESISHYALIASPMILKKYFQIFVVCYSMLTHACKANNYESVDIICNLIVKREQIIADIQMSAIILQAACFSGNMSIVNRVNELLATYEKQIYIHDVKCYGLFDACDVIFNLGFRPVDNTGSYVVGKYCRDLIYS